MIAHLRALRTAWRRCPRPRGWVIAAEIACYVGDACGWVISEAERRSPAYAQIKRLLRSVQAAPMPDTPEGFAEGVMARMDAARQSGYLRAHLEAAERMATGKGKHTNGNGHHIEGDTAP